MDHLTGKIIKRLTLYHFILTQYSKRGETIISSPKIAALLHIDNSQVRKDLKFVQHVGRCKVGYDVASLKANIEKLLKFQEPKKAFIVGAGNLGSALVKDNEFRHYGLDILALFDNDPLKIGISLNSKQVFPIAQLANFVRDWQVEIALLTVPKDAAQSCADFLVESGIKYIWNFAPCILEVPDNVKVWHENLIGNFLQFIIEEKIGGENENN